MEDVPAESRIVLEFRDLSCFVPRLFPASGGGAGKGKGGGPGFGAGSDLMRSATVLGRSVTRSVSRRRQHRPPLPQRQQSIDAQLGSVVVGGAGDSTVKPGSISFATSGGSQSQSQQPTPSVKPTRQVRRKREKTKKKRGARLKIEENDFFRSRKKEKSSLKK